MLDNCSSRPGSRRLRSLEAQPTARAAKASSGKRVLYKRMNAGESLGMNTYVTHPWVFADAGGQCRTIVLPDPARAVVSIR